MSFATVCRRIRKFSAGVGSVTSAPNSCRSKSASSSKVIEKISKIRRNMYFSADCGHCWNFKSICIALFAIFFFENEERKHLMGPTFAQ